MSDRPHLIQSLRFAATAGAVAILAAATAPAVAAPAPATGPTPAASATTTVTGATECKDPIAFGYYRQWRDVETTKEEDRAPNVQRMDEIPPQLDIVSAFATKPAQDPDFWVALRDKYVPALHAQGTEVVFTIFIDDIADADVELDEAAYDAHARWLVEEYVDRAGLDGLDIDTERSLDAEQTERAAGIIRALGKYLGPQSGTGRYLIYDTNMTGKHPLFPQIAPYVDYVLLQAYGRDPGRLQGTWETFAPYISSCQFLPGFSFYEERGAHWLDTTVPFGESRAAAYAGWQPEGGGKGGIFSYALDRDGKLDGDDTISTTKYTWMKRLSGIIDEVAR